MKKIFQYKLIKEVEIYKKKELNFLIYRSVFSDLRFPSYLRYYNLLCLNYFGHKINLNKVNYFCPETKQMKGVVKFFNTYRMSFRENVSFANYSGIKKSSW